MTLNAFPSAMDTPLSRKSIFLSLLALVPGALSADVASIVNRSPFLPPSYASRVQKPLPQAAPVTPQNYEFRGFFAIDDDVRVLVKAKEDQNGKWIRVDDPSSIPHILSFDPKERSLVLVHNGSEVKLNLTELAANSNPIPVAGQNTTPAPRPAIQNPNDATSRTSIRRRTVPPRRPQWMQDRQRELAASGNGSNTNAPTQGPPTEIPSLPPGGFPDPGAPPMGLPPDLPADLIVPDGLPFGAP